MKNSASARGVDFIWRESGSGGFHQFGKRIYELCETLDVSVRSYDSMMIRRGGPFGFRSVELYVRITIESKIRRFHRNVINRVICEAPDFLERCPRSVYGGSCFVTTFEFASQVRRVRYELASVAKIVVPTEWHRNCLEDQGLSPARIFVTPLPHSTNKGALGFSSRVRVNSAAAGTNIATILSSLDRRDTAALIRGFATFLRDTTEPVTLTLKVPTNDDIELLNLQVREICRSMSLSDEGAVRLRTSIRMVCGWQTDEEIIELLRQCDAYVSCERLTGWDIPLHDALDLDIPAVSLRSLSEPGELALEDVELARGGEIGDGTVAMDRVSQVTGDADLINLFWPRLSEDSVCACIREIVGEVHARKGARFTELQAHDRPSDMLAWSSVFDEVSSVGRNWRGRGACAKGQSTYDDERLSEMEKALSRRNALLFVSILSNAFRRSVSQKGRAGCFTRSSQRNLRTFLLFECGFIRAQISRNKFALLLRIGSSAHQVRNAFRVLRLSNVLDGMRRSDPAMPESERWHAALLRVPSTTAEQVSLTRAPDSTQRGVATDRPPNLFQRRLLESAFSGVPLAKSDVSRLYAAHHARGRRSDEIFVIGNAPSLNHVNLEALRHVDTFAVNRINLLFERWTWRPTYYTCMDWEVGPPCFENFDSDKTVLFSPLRFRGLPGTKDALFYGVRDISSSHEFEPYLYPIIGMPSGATVITTAISIASFLGYKTIVLLGVDCDYKVPTTTKREVSQLGSIDVIESLQDDDPNHFSPEYFGKGWRWHDPKPHDMIEKIGEQARLLQRNRIEVINGSPYGKLDSIRRVVRPEIWTSL